ncbi:glycosyltransferase family 4 protein [Tsuneonella troitsensis]|uniref:glycosyltransferase family 4 protein n=1 Tax=Tsuneonella troitsensis TaxID=292222 RepID=UPI00070B4896|nr:glycosyltransferase family 4 protein [Tsuneonella troitsensis]
MKIVFFTYYFPPDLSAGSFRASALVEALLDRMGEDDSIKVVTTSPNRYARMEITESQSFADPRLNVKRVHIPQHESGVVDQANGFRSFARGALAASANSTPDLVLATSSRLLTATLGAFAARRWRVPLYLDIRDIFSETIENVFAAHPIRFAVPFVNALERWTVRSASRINVVSPAFLEHFEPIAVNTPTSVYTNGVDQQFLDFRRQHPVPLQRPGRPVVVAAGNIGEGQGLHHIVPGLAAAHPDVDFRIIGGGGRRAELESAVLAARNDNVTIINPVSRDRLTEEYANASVLFMHLNDLPAFDRVVPSKMFEYAATGRPILAGVRGRSDAMLSQVAGVERFPPCDVAAAASALSRLLDGPRQHDRDEFVAQFDRRKIMAAMAEEIIATASGGDAVSAAATQEGLQNDPHVQQ